MSAAALLLLLGCGQAPSGPDRAASSPVAPRLLSVEGRRLAPLVGGPAFATPTDAALGALHALPGLRGPARAQVGVEQLLPLPSGGAVVRLAARHQGRRILDSEVRVLVDGEGRARWLSLGSAVEQGLQAGPVRGAAWRVSAPEALARVREGELGLSPSPVATADEQGEWTLLQGPGLGRARARAVWRNEPAGLGPAWELELWTAPAEQTEGRALRALVDAGSGQLLQVQELQVQDSFEYEVFVDAGGRPLDGPVEDLSPHPGGGPDGRVPASIEGGRIGVEGFNLNPDGLPDPWLAAGSEETRGNNADAYADHRSPDGFSSGDSRAPTSDAGVFGWTLDPTRAPTADDEQTWAAIVQAFYTVNWLHDWYYDAGFTEALGNAQTDNYGRGGVEGDPLLIEAQDGAFSGSRNNANMSTPADGSSPRMQIYLWSARSTTALIVEPGSLRPDVGVASFGLQSFDVEAPLVLPGSDPLGCSIDADVSGAIVFAVRGTCTFVEKARAAQEAGAVGLVIASATPAERAFSMSGAGSDISIGLLSVGYDDGTALYDLLTAEDEVQARLLRDPGVEVDGAFDATVVAHEWGHYLLGRLVGCSTQQCGAINEGHADFVALSMMLREGDDLDGVYPVGAYATAGYSIDPAWYGIRRVPYSTNTAYNALSFRHIQEGEALPTSHPMAENRNSNASVHNAGEIWATAMHGAQVALLKAREERGRSFEETQRRVAEILVGGLALSPSDPTYTELRDALIAVAAVEEPQDAVTIAQAFADRGMGTCAVSPARSSLSLTGVVEDDALAPIPVLGPISLDDGRGSCDGDGVLDAGELGWLRVEVENGGPLDLDGASLRAAVDGLLPGLVLDEEAVGLPIVPAFGRATIELPVGISGDTVEPGSARLLLELDAPAACETSTQGSAWARTEADLARASSYTETFEVEDGGWLVDGDEDGEIWSLQEQDDGGHAWVGLGVSGVTDSRLVSPVLWPAADRALVLRLEHAYRFEKDRTAAWDGGVLELSVDGGEWQDISAWVEPGYTDTLSTRADNPLGGRRAFSGASAGWPALQALELDLGTAFAGRSLRFSLRIGTDQATSADGWVLGGVEVDGVDRPPFDAWGADATDCDLPPVATAGEDLRLYEGEEARLDAGASADPWGQALAVEWQVPAGAPLSLDDPRALQPTLHALEVEADTEVELVLVVDDGRNRAEDRLLVQVLDRGGEDTGDGGADGGTVDGGGDGGGSAPIDEVEAKAGCGCQGGGAMPGLPLLGLLGLLRRVRARRR